MGCGYSGRKDTNHIKNKNLNDLSVQPGNYIKFNTKEFAKVYSVGRSLGKGTFGEVKFCTHLKTSSRRAVKIFKKSALMTEDSKKKFEKEVQILKALDHPNIIRVYEFFEDLSNFYIVMEHCRGGELFEELLKSKKFTEQQSAQVMRQLFSCISYLHSIGITHRDLKPENILFEEKSDFGNLKLVDFGSADFFSKEKKMKGSLGTAYYVAPEVLKGGYTEKCDMWSAGVILYIMIVGVPPFNGSNNVEIFKSISAIEYDTELPSWLEASNDAKNLISNLLVPESQRLTPEQALSHPWIKNNCKTILNKKILSHAFVNLSSFETKNKIKDAIRSLISSQLMTSEETKQAKEIFKELDENGDGKLSKEELMQGYSKIMNLNEAREHVEKIMKHVDSDNNGYIEYSEFLKAAIDNNMIMSHKNLKLAFDMIDKDGNGKISSKELKNALQGDNDIDEFAWQQIFKQFGGNGEIDIKTFQEFLSTEQDEI